MSVKQQKSIPVIDLFAGPGGLGEGFSSLRHDGHDQPFRIHLSVESDPFAHASLVLRAFFRQFRSGHAPGAYYDVLRGTTTVDDLFARFPSEAIAARSEAWCATLGETPRSVINERITKALGSASAWILIGGPPCQAYSIAGRSRNNGIKDYKPDDDHRQYLYVEYLQAIADHWPAVFVMENVKGLLSANVNRSRIFKRILEDLQSPADALKRESRAVESARKRHKYRIVPLTSSSLPDFAKVDDYVVAAERHGVPQSRHRVFLVGIRDDVGEVRLPGLTEMPEVPMSRVIDGLPRLRSGLSTKDSDERWASVLQAADGRRWLASTSRMAGPDVEFAIREAISALTIPRRRRGAPFIEGDFTPEYRPDWFGDGRLDGICQHETRCHADSDLHRYLFVASFGKIHGRSPILKEFPADLLPAHESVDQALENGGFFNDRFRVQVRNKPASTVMSHIHKDGHYYIHPDVSQCRSLTLREAARLQTFPDNYFFSGSRTKGYVQVGNAVPPLLAQRIADSVWTLLRDGGLIK